MGAYSSDCGFGTASPRRWLALLLGILLAVPSVAFGQRSLSLKEAQDLARQSSPGIAQSHARLDEAEADWAAARSALLPKIWGAAYWSWLDPDRLSPVGASQPGAAAPTLYGREGYAAVRGKLVLFDGLKSWATLDSARRGVQSEQVGTRIAQADTVLGVSLAFVRLLEAQQLVGVAQRSLERQVAFEKVIQAKLDLGQGARLDLLKARAQRFDAERALVTAGEAQRVASALLRRAIGLESREELAARGTLEEPAGEPPAPEAILAATRAANPELQRLDAQLQQSRASARATRGGYLPEVSLQGAFGYRDRDLGGGAGEWSAGVYLDWSLFDGLATRAQGQKADARLAQLLESRRALELQIDADVSEVLGAVLTARAAARSASQSVEASREAVEAALELYRIGRATSLDVLTSQSELARTEVLHFQALGDWTVALARLERLTGD
ncbi:MAG: TolC family protein [Deltaproteobacteria bacterium]|nr:TolC family protein [Deltaproteobacteria bacterium]